MKKSKMFLLISICGFMVFGLTGCFKGKKVVITDTKTNTTYVIDENGATVEGTLPLGDGVEVTVTEEE